MDPIPIPSINPPKTPKCPSCPFHLLLFFNFSLLAATATSEIHYSTYCNHIVPESSIDPTKPSALSASQSLLLSAAFYSGGDPFFHFYPVKWPNSAKFLPTFSRRTAIDDVFSLQARLTLTIPPPGVPGRGGRSLRQQLFRVRGPKFPVRRDVARFRLSGYWSKSNGKLCMVGSGSKYEISGKVETFNVVLKLNYSSRLNVSVVDSLVSGVLESVDFEDSLSYFKPISILGVAQFDERHYDFTLLDKENISGSSFVGGIDQVESLSINDVDKGVCSLLGLRNFRFDLKYGGDCGIGSDNVNCNPVDGNAGAVPGGSLFLKGVRCEEKQRMHMLLGFWNSSFMSLRFPFDPNTTLIAEGAWDEKRNQLLGVGCRILNFTESLAKAYVGDCSVRLSLRFPAVFNIRNRDTIVGQIWSSRSENDSKYFGKIGFGSSEEVLIGLPGFRYNYSMLGVARKSCTNKNVVRHKGKSYPNAYSVDMRFDMLVKNSKGQTARGFASPFFVNDQFYEHQLYGRQLVPPLLRSNASVIQLSNNHSSLLNISYKISFTPEFGFNLGKGEISPSETVKISAEGIYDRDTGVLCMIGCRQLKSGHQKENLTKNDSLDCEIAINVQFRALNAKGIGNIKGTIESIRGKSDALYFGRLELATNSIYTAQAVDSVWRMDLEITMVLISSTLACVFVGIQLYYVKKHPEVLPFISVVMLIILTLRYMIPLLLNFEALFKANSNQQNIFLGSGGWLETNEIIVRVVTMVAFLLQFRLLQLTWSARQGDGSQKDLWISDKKVLYVCLPLYIAGGLIAWAVYLLKNSYRSHFLQPHRVFSRRWDLYHQHSFWDVLKSYAGLVLDGFLLPQIMFNMFFNSTEKALAASFYIGTTLVRLLPHAYDLYRAHSSAWYLDISYIYANPKMDLYSTAWDIIITCGGLFFAALIFLQQRLGGRFILPQRFKNGFGYEKVSISSSVELQEDAVNKNSYCS